MLNNLGRLKKVDLREIWVHEATSFTRWLSQEENLDHLGDELGISIKLLKTEAEVGGFNVDILAEEEGSARKIIIENQLETTDHDHLGKLITCASGTDANVIIWIFREIREEHRSAIDWLNEHTDENIWFFRREDGVVANRRFVAGTKISNRQQSKQLGENREN